MVEHGRHEPPADALPHALGTYGELVEVDVDGDFGPKTAEAVREVQEAAELEPTGVVDGPTWAAVEAAAIEAEVLPGAPGLAAQREKAAEEKAAKEKAAKEEAQKKAAEEKAAQEAAFEASLANADR